MCDNGRMITKSKRKLYRSGEAAQMIGVHRSTLTKWVREGRVKASGNMLGQHYVWTLEKINEIRQEMGLEPLEDER